MKLFYHRAADNGNHQTENHIDNSNLPAEDAHKQHQTSQVHHGRGNQKREGYAKGQTCAGKTNEQRNGRTGAERCHRPQQSCYTVCTNAMKSAKDAFGAFRREVALDVRDNEDQYTQQHHNFDHIIDKELDASTPTRSSIDSKIA